MTYAPIAIFTYNRPEHTKKTIEALKKNKLAPSSEVFIYSDGPKNNNNQEGVVAVREYLTTIDGFKNIKIITRDNNWGLAKSIIAGVTELTNKYGRVIVVEDDLITSPYFLAYMNDALELYQNDEQVMHISGYFFPVKNNLSNTFFYNNASCWGWATWKRAWKHFNSDAGMLYKKIINSNQMKKFNVDGFNDNFEKQLLDNANGKIHTWAIKWQASILLRNGLCLHPKKSLVKNIGFDGSGINCNTNKTYDVEISNIPIKVTKIPFQENQKARFIMKKFYKRMKPNIFKSFLKKLINHEI